MTVKNELYSMEELFEELRNNDLFIDYNGNYIKIYFNNKRIYLRNIYTGHLYSKDYSIILNSSFGHDEFNSIILHLPFRDFCKKYDLDISRIDYKTVIDRKKQDIVAAELILETLLDKLNLPLEFL